MKLVTQMAVVTRLSLMTLPKRVGASLVIVVSMAFVVGVLLSVLSVTFGILRAYEIAGSPARAIVFSTDSYRWKNGRMEELSHISRDAAGVILGGPGIARDPDGKPRIEAEALAGLPPVEGFAFGSLFVRGIGPNSLRMRPQFKIVLGRMFRPGVHEIIVGMGAERIFGLKVGDRIIMPDGEWPIVGEFTAGGGIMESELMGDAPTVMAAIERSTEVSSVLVDLDSPAAFAPFKQWLTTNPALALTAERQSDYYRWIAGNYASFFTAVAYLVGVIMALGALFGFVKIMHTSVNARAREIATLRAIGYDALPVATSVLLEAMLLSLVGALLGAWVARIVFAGRWHAVFNAVFTLSVSTELIVLGLAWALLLAILGGIGPAVRAARLPVAVALRRA